MCLEIPFIASGSLSNLTFVIAAFVIVALVIAVFVIVALVIAAFIIISFVIAVFVIVADFAVVCRSA